MGITETYRELFSAFNCTQYKVYTKEGKKEVDFSKLSHFVAMKGKYFDDESCRLMIIGRAVNGWGSIAAENNIDFGEKANNTFNSKGFEWVITTNEVLSNEDGTYKLSQSPFWRTAQGIWEQLSGKQENRWIDYIAWSNIYKIAPPETGNPNNNMCKHQITQCRELLKTEIEIYKPTHILLVTGWHWWFDDEQYGIGSIFTDHKFIAHNNRTNMTYVEGNAKYNDIPVVVACRPEGRKENEYINQIVSSFNNK